MRFQVVNFLCTLNTVLAQQIFLTHLSPQILLLEAIILKLPCHKRKGTYSIGRGTTGPHLPELLVIHHLSRGVSFAHSGLKNLFFLPSSMASISHLRSHFPCNTSYHALLFPKTMHSKAPKLHIELPESMFEC